MRTFTDDARFTVRSIPEIFESVTTLVARFRGKGVQLGGRFFSREVLVNCLFVHFAGLSPEAQAAVIADGMARLEVLLGQGEASDSPPETDVVKHTAQQPPAKGRKRLPD